MGYIRDMGVRDGLVDLGFKGLNRVHRFVVRAVGILRLVLEPVDQRLHAERLVRPRHPQRFDVSA